MYRHLKISRATSLLLVFAMVVSMLGITPAFAASTNPSVAAAVAAAVGTTPPADVMILDLSGYPLTGDLDVSEITSDYPNLLYLNIGGTNITSVTNVPAGVTIDNYDTIASGTRYISDAQVSVPDYSKIAQTPIDIQAIYDAMTLHRADGSEIALPAGLVDSVSYAIDANALVTDPVASLGTVSAAGESTGSHTLHVQLNYANSANSAAFSFPFHVTDTSLP
jgi:hypothetical protein